MNKAEAKNIVINALDYKYEIKSFEAFLSNLFKNLTFFDKLKSKTPESFKSVIDSYTQLGEFTDSQNNRISILEVSLNQQNSIGKARSTQRNFIAHYLKNNNYVAALVAFISKDSTDWRLSLVKLEFVAEFIDDKLKSKDEITPARRWSFLVGEHEGCHTAISRFVPLIESAYEPNLEELEYAFNIEKVTDEFYEKYKNLFLIIKDELDRLILKDEKIKNDFVTKQLKTEDFAKKTLGQLAFIYFLQKKGWFGVKPGENWTTGSKLFLRDLYNKKSKYGTNFFNDVLEFLFYEALATDRGSESIYKKFDCKIPFLNGGLFEPMNGYSWETTEILLNDQLFSNSNITPEGDIGDGILDVFDRYNFTVNESEPLEKEVAVDPEMLGKVFENLLGVNDRKSKGAFYTPREIVHYICQEALIEYLNTNLNNEILLPGIRKFVSLGIIDEIEIYSSNVDELLSELKVCDPAVGSGAFPLGMLNEIVRLRQILNLYLKKNKTKYQLKLETISNSLYGVDVDSGAIEIAKLRMWLSLVVDEDNPSPLPNLDHKLMQGNSLVSKFHGIEIFDDNLLLTNKNNLEIIKKLEEHKKSLESKFLELSQNNFLTEKLNLELTELKKELKKINKNITDIKVEKPQLINHSSNLLFGEKEEDEEIAVKKSHELQQKIKLYLNESQKSLKEKLKEAIDNLKWDLIELSFGQSNKNSDFDEIKLLRQKNEKPFFIWKLEFNDVFLEKGGFDIVIGNPPYVDSEEMTKHSKALRDYCNINYSSSKGNWDLFCVFIEKAILICNKKGISSMIVPNKLISANYAKSIRDFISENTTLLSIRDYSKVKVFQVSVYPIVYSCLNRKSLPSDNFHYELMAEGSNQPEISNLFNQAEFNLAATNDWSHLFSKDHNLLLNKISKNKELLGNISNVIGSATVSEAYLIKEFLSELNEDNNKYLKFINTGTIDRYKPLWESYPTRYIKDSYIKPVILEEDYIKLPSRRLEESFSEKIIIGGMTKCLECVLDNGTTLAGKSTTLVLNTSYSLYYLLAILNSKLMTYFYKNRFAGLSLQGGFFRIGPPQIRLLPIVIPDINSEEYKEIIDLVIKINNPSNLSKFEEMDEALDDLIFDLYLINKEERKIIEANLES